MIFLHFFITVLLPLCAIAASPSLHEQRCYYDNEKLAPADIIPCYTSYRIGAACCKRGDKCMEKGTCYNQDTGVTYQYGCTDPIYHNEHCPSKCSLDRNKSNWVGLIYCDNSWLCHHPDNCGKTCKTSPWSPLIEKLPPIQCEDVDKQYKIVTISSNPLKDELVLPSAYEDVMSYLSAYPSFSRRRKPSTAASTSITASSALFESSTTPKSSTSSPLSSKKPPKLGPSASPSMSDPPESPTIAPDSPSPESSPETSSNPSEKSHGNSKGVAIGVGAGVPAALALVGALVFLFRRHRRQFVPDGAAPGMHDISDGYDTYDNANVAPMRGSGSGYGQGPGYEYKAELSGEDRPIHEMLSPAPPTELEGSSIYDRSAYNEPAELQSPLGSLQDPVYPNDMYAGGNYAPSTQGGQYQEDQVHSDPIPEKHEYEDRDGDGKAPEDQEYGEEAYSAQPHEGQDYDDQSYSPQTLGGENSDDEAYENQGHNDHEYSDQEYEGEEQDDPDYSGEGYGDSIREMNG